MSRRTLLLGLLLALWLLAACHGTPLLRQVHVSPATISPNGDGVDDGAEITFTLTRPATVTIALYDAQGRRYTFRAPIHLPTHPRPHRVRFYGVVEGFRRADDPADLADLAILRRMLPDGRYTWAVEAVADDGTRQTVTGTLTLRDADTQLPAIRGFSIYPKVFSPNQDGIADRVTLNLVLPKDVESLRVYLLGEDGTRRYIPEYRRPHARPNARGWHTFDYDGGIDAGADPPPDGAYTVYAEAQDVWGQHVLVSGTLGIVNAGMPRAYILNGEVDYSTDTLRLGDTLCYSLTVENDSDAYLRTTGPWPGTTYRNDENFNALGWSEESGVFRVGMDFEFGLRNYPFRWGIGTPGENLVEIDGYWYLPPRATSIVTGCVQVVEPPIRPTIYYWMGLIHEDVEIARVNNHVDPHAVTMREGQ